MGFYAVSDAWSVPIFILRVIGSLLGHVMCTGQLLLKGLRSYTEV